MKNRREGSGQQAAKKGEQIVDDSEAERYKLVMIGRKVSEEELE